MRTPKQVSLRRGGHREGLATTRKMRPQSVPPFGKPTWLPLAPTIPLFISHPPRLFSRQQYFDSKGMFISLVFSVPILLNCMIMVANWLWQSSQLMINLKKAQLRQAQFLRQRSERETSSGVEETLSDQHPKID
uniref:Uncharacterized protein n=1 Tax=Timema bartmani TaxID=61472 RepID=A0A7R9ESZ1_9NEOP|nr:unnamed protein product [Timema bartmani]